MPLKVRKMPPRVLKMMHMQTKIYMAEYLAFVHKNTKQNFYFQRAKKRW